VNPQTTSNFKAQALDEDTLRRRAPSIFATGPMSGSAHGTRFSHRPDCVRVAGAGLGTGGRREQRIGWRPAVVFRNICSVPHSGLEPDQVVRSSLRLIEFMPRVGELVAEVRDRLLDGTESRRFAEQALLLRYPSWKRRRSNPRRCFRRAGPRTRGTTSGTPSTGWGEPQPGGVSDHRLDRRGRLRSVRGIRGIDSKVSLNKTCGPGRTDDHRRGTACG